MDHFRIFTKLNVRVFNAVHRGVCGQKLAQPSLTKPERKLTKFSAEAGPLASVKLFVTDDVSSASNR